MPSYRGGLITYWRRLSATRRIGWQFQENQLRFFISIEDPGLRGKARRAAREAVVEAGHADFFDHCDVEAILGSDLRAKAYAPGEWRGFNPDFVYRHRPVKTAVSTVRTEARRSIAVSHSGAESRRGAPPERGGAPRDVPG